MSKPQRLQLLRYDAAGQLLDTVDVLPHGEIVVTDGTQHLIGRPLLQWDARTATSKGRVFLTRGNESSVEVRDSAWTLTNIIRWDEGDWRATAIILAAERDAALKGVTDPAERTNIVQRYATMPASDRIPAVVALKADARGRLWVGRYRRPSEVKNAWWGFAPDGAFLCTLSLPKAFELTEFGDDYLLGIATADAGFEMAQVFGLVVGR